MKNRRNTKKPQTWKHYYVIGTGVPERPESVGIHWFEHRTCGKTMFLFTSKPKADLFISRTLNTPQSHMEMLESGGTAIAKGLTEGRFFVMRDKLRNLAVLLAAMGVSSLIIDPNMETNENKVWGFGVLPVA